METAAVMIAATFLDAEKAGRAGAVAVVEFDPQAEGVLVPRVRDDDWRPALACLPNLIDAFTNDGVSAKIIVFSYGIGDVAELYREPDLTVLTNAFADACGERNDLARDDRGELDVICDFAAELERQNISFTFIGEGFTWMFDRSTSTYRGSPTAQKPLVPVINVT